MVKSFALYSTFQLYSSTKKARQSFKLSAYKMRMCTFYLPLVTFNLGKLSASLFTFSLCSFILFYFFCLFHRVLFPSGADYNQHN